MPAAFRFSVTRDYFFLFVCLCFNNSTHTDSFFCFVFTSYEFNWFRHVFQVCWVFFLLSYTISFTFVIVNIWIVISECVCKCLFFFSSAFLLRHKLKFIFHFFFILHGKLQHKWTFSIQFLFSFLLGWRCHFEWNNIQKTDIQILIYIDFCLNFRDFLRVVEGSCWTLLQPTHTQLSTWGSFFRCFFFALKLGSFTFRVNFLFGFRYWLMKRRCWARRKATQC